MRVVVVGGGFAGAILARVARAQGHDVTLVERGRHPRFALGESSTPLAALALERLAARYGLDDLRALAAYGRWTAALPAVRRGLKRGFTFYRHDGGRPFRNDAANGARLLVAASPDDAVADAHWLREDVDDHLVRRAADEDVRYLEGTTVAGATERDTGVRLRLEHEGSETVVDADLVVDASGEAGAVAARLGAAQTPWPGGPRTGLVFGHFEGVAPLRAAAPDAVLPPGPYPDERAAVHHLLDEGWMYELRFDHGVTSVGFVLERGAGGPALDASTPEAAFAALLARHPTLAAQFADARPVRPVGVITQLQRRRTLAAGARWTLLPHTYAFLSPLFSTGIAWSLLCVERLGLVLESAAPDGDPAPDLRRYAELLAREADHLRALVAPAYAARHRFAAFDAVSQVYFAAASFAEARQRLCDPEPGSPWAWSGFLGAGDPVTEAMVAGMTDLARDGDPAPLARAARLIAPRNVAGLADPGRRRLYPVDLDALADASNLLGLTRDELRARLPRLRG